MIKYKLFIGINIQKILVWKIMRQYFHTSWEKMSYQNVTNNVAFSTLFFLYQISLGLVITSRNTTRYKSFSYFLRDLVNYCSHNEIFHMITLCNLNKQNQLYTEAINFFLVRLETGKNLLPQMEIKLNLCQINFKEKPFVRTIFITSQFSSFSLLSNFC